MPTLKYGKHHEGKEENAMMDFLGSDGQEKALWSLDLMDEE